MLNESDTLAWIRVCKTEELAPEDVYRFDHGSHSFAIYRNDRDEYFATDGFCTHARVHLAGGLVMGNTIECPKHNGRFDICTGKPLGAPVLVALSTYEIRLTSGEIYLRLPAMV